MGRSDGVSDGTRSQGLINTNGMLEVGQGHSNDTTYTAVVTTS